MACTTYWYLQYSTKDIELGDGLRKGLHVEHVELIIDNMDEEVHFASNVMILER